MPVVTAGIPDIDNCPILTRLKAFIVDQGVVATLEHTFRDKIGNPADLSEYFPSESSDSSAAYGVTLRTKEWLGEGICTTKNPVWEVSAEIVDASAGLVRATLDAETVAQAGIYECNWAVVDSEDAPHVVDRGILSIERSLFGDLRTVKKGLGPPTLQELRMRLMDSSASENLLLQDTEFKDEQLLLAMFEPVRAWNESLPPLRTFTTRDFPFRGAWIMGVQAQLYMTAAGNYRRNRLKHIAGGVAVDDLNKEQEYMAEGVRLWNDYKDWMGNKKVSINMRLVTGSVQSAYYSRSGW